MKDILNMLFGVVAMNKISILFGNGKRSGYAQVGKLIVENYAMMFENGGFNMKAYLVIAPIINIFIFGGLFSFLFVVASDLYLLRKLLNK